MFNFLNFFKKDTPLLLSDDLKNLRNKILSLSNDNKSFVSTISGDWGKGKTFFWNNIIKKDLLSINKEVSYISLFGKQDITEIKTEILLQVSKDEKKLKYISTFASNIQILGTKIDLGAILNSLGQENFEDTIICFDDLERLSDSIKIKELIGLISMLKEQKNCKVFIILNEAKLETQTATEYSISKEKIIDYEFKFLPSIDNLYDVIKKDLLYFNEYPLVYFKAKDINNIRVMKRVINALNDFSFIKEFTLEKEIEHELAENIIEIFIVYSIFNKKEFTKISNYTFDKIISKDDEFELIDDYEKQLDYINYKDNYEINDITRLVLDYLDSFLIHKDKVKEILINQNNNYNDNITRKNINRYINQYQFDLKYNNKQFKIDIDKVIKDNHNINQFVSVEQFKYIIEICESVEPTDTYNYKLFAISTFEKYIDEFIESTDKNVYKPWEEERLRSIYAYDNGLKEYYTEKVNNYISDLITNEKIIVEILQNPFDNVYSKANISTTDILAFVTEDRYYEMILKEDGFFKFLNDFLDETKDHTNFYTEKNKILRVYELIISSTTIENDIKNKVTKLKEYLLKKGIKITADSTEDEE